MRRSLIMAAIAAALIPAYAEAHQVHWQRTGASVYGQPCESGSTGYRGENLDTKWGRRSFAELGNGFALGGLPNRTAIRVLDPRTHRRMTIRKRDIGLGGGNVDGLSRTIDLRQPVAHYLNGAGCNWTGVVLYRQLR